MTTLIFAGSRLQPDRHFSVRRRGKDAPGRPSGRRVGHRRKRARILSAGDAADRGRAAYDGAMRAQAPRRTSYNVAPLQRPRRPTRMTRFRNLPLILAAAGLLGFAAVLFTVLAAYVYVAPGLPDVATLKDVRLEAPMRVYSRDGRLLAEFGEKRRVPLTYDEIPRQVVHAFVAAEDDRFFQHPGVDYQGLVRAGVAYATTGERRQGGSTITMQVARNFLLTAEKTFLRKVREIFLAIRIEGALTKEEILTLYLNKIFLGQRAFGVGAAAEVYYGKPLGQLRLDEIATLAGLPKAPSTDNPVASPERALHRRAYVLRRMLELGFIDEASLRAGERRAHRRERARPAGRGRGVLRRRDGARGHARAASARRRTRRATRSGRRSTARSRKTP